MSNTFSSAVTHAAAAAPAKVSSSALLQRQCACGQHTLEGECSECRKKTGILQRRPPGAPAIKLSPTVRNTLRSSGQPLDWNTRAIMEARFGQDFTGVRLHSDAAASVSARQLNALAYTIGDHVVFQKEYKPASTDGQSMLAHELAHVVQNRKHGANFAPTTAGAISHPHDPAEREASAVAAQVLAGKSVSPIATPLAVIHRISDEAKTGLEIGGAVVGGLGVVAGIASLAGAFITEGDLQDYLKKLDQNGKIEDAFHSDQKARRIADSWAQGETKFLLTIRRRSLMIQEMMTGHVSHWDKNGIMQILEYSDFAALTYIFSAGGVSHEKLIAALSDWKDEVRSFYKRRFRLDDKPADIDTIKDFSKLTAAKLALPVQPGDEVPKEGGDDLATKRRTQVVNPEESDKWVVEAYGPYLSKEKAGGKFIQKKVDINTASGDEFAYLLQPSCERDRDWNTEQKKKETGSSRLSKQDKDEINRKYDNCLHQQGIAGFYETPEEAGKKKGQISIKTDAETASTRLHEALHAYTDPAVKEKLPKFANEGMTEYLTRQIALRKNLLISNATNYNGPVLAIEELVAEFGETMLKEVYFQGKVNLICKNLVEKFGTGAYKAWAEAMSDYETWEDAVKVLQRPKVTQPPKNPEECNL